MPYYASYLPAAHEIRELPLAEQREWFLAHTEQMRSCVPDTM
ncbi:hypothetical protein ACFV5N_09925 [Streptomyces sp. NPDC059853]